MPTRAALTTISLVMRESFRVMTSAQATSVMTARATMMPYQATLIGPMVKATGLMLIYIILSPCHEVSPSTKAAASKATMSSSPSPVPMSSMGRPSSSQMARTMPPLAVPSSLARKTPVTPTASVK